MAAIVARCRPTDLLVAPDDQPWLAFAATRLERIADGPDGVFYRVEGGHEPTQPP